MTNSSESAPLFLVTGGLGVMGTTLCKGLIERGMRVRVLDIPNHPHKDRLEGTGAEVVFADITNPDSMKGAFDGVSTVYHLAAILLSPDPSRFEKINVQGTKNVINASIEAGVNHFVLTSSISVTYEHHTPYSNSKLDCETAIKGQDKMDWTIVRPSLAYNSYGGEEFMMYVNHLRKHRIVPIVGSGRALKNPVHVDDLLNGFFAIANNPKAVGKTYPFCGSEEISIKDLGKLILKHLGLNHTILTVPLPVCRMLAAVTAKTMKRPPLSPNAITGFTQDATPDWAEAKADLGYDPIGITEGMQRSFPI